MIGNEQRRIFPLSLAAAGEAVEVIDTHEPDAMRHRLNELGLTTGTIVRVVQADKAGAMILALRGDTRLVVGRSTAHQVRVCLRHER